MLIIDNYDSFTYNIVQYIKILGINPIVIKNDDMDLEKIKRLDFSRIILSPGWGNPDNSGVTMDIIDFYKDKCPILGVCLGMQCIAKYFGGEIVKAPEPYHGKNSEIFFDKDFGLFKGFKQGFSATRYHSLMVKKISPHPNPPPIKGGSALYSTYQLQNNKFIQITAWTKDNIPMALKIKNKPIYGVQFHPEAILTEYGLDIFRNFLEA